MSLLNILELKDRLLDVDSDFRFMGLQDFNRYLVRLYSASYNTNYQPPLSGKLLMSLIPTLLHLLQDQNANVQTQAINIFASLTPFLAPESLLSVINDLYAKILENALHPMSANSFTTSIPYMALKNLICGNKVSTRDECAISCIDYTCAKSILELLLPLIVSNESTIDLAELLIDLIRQFGNVLEQREIPFLVERIISVAFDKSGIISKRSITAFELLANYVKTQSIFNDAVSTIRSYLTSKGKREFVCTSCLFYSIILSNPLGLDSAAFIDLYNDLIPSLALPDARALMNGNGSIDLDFDMLLEANTIRDNVLCVFFNIIKSDLHTEVVQEDLFEIICCFLQFDPLCSRALVDNIDFEDEHVEFSDDENASDTYEDDGSWKLRCKASGLARLYSEKWHHQLQKVLCHMYPILPINDKNDLVFDESISTMAALLETSKHSDSDVVGDTEEIVFKVFLESPRATRLSAVLSIATSLCSAGNSSFMPRFYDKLSYMGTATWQLCDILTFHNDIVEKCNLKLMPAELCLMANDVIRSLEDPLFHLNIQGLKLLLALLSNQGFKDFDFKADAIINLVVEKVIKYKSNSFIVGKLCLQVLGAAVCRDADAEGIAYRTLLLCLEIESLSKSTLQVLASRIERFGFDVLQATPLLVRQLFHFATCRDEETRVNALNLLFDLVDKSTSRIANDDLAGGLLEVIRARDPICISHAFKILNILLPKLLQPLKMESELFAIIVDLMNSNQIDQSCEYLIPLIDKIAISWPESFDFVTTKLKFRCELETRILASIAVATDRSSEIEARECRILNTCESTDLSQDDLISLQSDIQFVNFLLDKVPIKHIKTLHIVKLLHKLTALGVNGMKTVADVHNQSKGCFKNALLLDAASTIGLLTATCMGINLKSLVDIYVSPENTIVRGLLVSAFNPVIPCATPLELKEIWQNVWLTVAKIDFKPINYPELKSSAQVLFEMAKRDMDYIRKTIDTQLNVETGHPHKDFENLSTLYTSAVMTKKLVKYMADTKGDMKVSSDLLSVISSHLDVLNVELRQLLVGNLLTALNNIPMAVLPILGKTLLPRIYTQLEPVPEFKRTIPMGPYKYIVDEGIEIRKLCHEFIHALLTFEGSLVLRASIPIADITYQVVKSGLSETSLDVLVVSTNTLRTVIDLHKTSFEALISQKEGRVLYTIIETLDKQLAKKLCDKASSQDIEAYNERIKAIVGLCKVIEACITRSSLFIHGDLIQARQDWGFFYSRVASSFGVFFHSSDAT